MASRSWSGALPLAGLLVATGLVILLAAQIRLGYHGPCDAQGSCYDLCIELFPLNDGVGMCFEPLWCCRCAER